jgi:glycosyltransferase involved in cell wall biosynthesis
VKTVDVVIPVRNGARFLPACLDSVLRQARAPHRIIIVDDGSTDTTPTVISEYAKRHSNIQMIRSKPCGVSSARNLGIRASTADLVAFLDSDDIWKPEKIARQAALFEDAPNVGFAHCSYFHIDQDGELLEGVPMVYPTKRGDIFLDLLDGYPLAGSASAVMARRELLLQVEGFDETLAHSEDQDVWLKLANVGRVDYVTDPLVGIREHDESVQRRPDRMRAEKDFIARLRVMQKWIKGLDRKPELLGAYRTEAIRLGLMRILFRFEFGFHRLMREQAPDVVDAMFENAADYRAGVRSIAMREILSLLARRVVVKSPLLLWCCHRMGKLKEIQG